MKQWNRNIGIMMAMVMIVFSFLIGRWELHASPRTIKVGWPIQQGLSMKDDKGNYSGYTYDYLQELAQYTGWTYEFVEVEGDINTQLTSLLEMLKQGEIDLLGAMRYNEATAQMFDFPSEGYGSFYSVLAILNDNEEIDEYNYRKKKDLKVGAIQHSISMTTRLEQFADVNQFTYELIEYETSKSLLDALQNKEIDTILISDVAMGDEMHQIARFGGSPFYFAITKGNNQVTKELNDGILQIQEAYPTLESELYEKYFKTKEDFNLTVQEKAYIQEHPILRVAYLDDVAPLSYMRDGACAGAAIDIMNQISEMSGIQIEYVRVHDFQDYRDLVEQGAFDVLLTYPYQIAAGKRMNLTLSKSYLDIPLTFVTRTGMTPQNLNEKTEAVVDGFEFHHHKSEHLYHVATVAEALEAVQTGKADYFYGIGAMVSYYMNQENYDQLQMIYGVEDSYGKLCYGIHGDASSLLTAILNKAIQAISIQDIEGYLYAHSYIQNDVSLLAFFDRYKIEVFCVVLLLLFMTIFAIYHHFSGQMKMKKQIEMENNRYKLLSEISGERIFEYDFLNDTLRVNVDREGTQRIIEHYYEDTKRHHSHELDHTLVPLIEEPRNLCELQLMMDGKTPRWHRIFSRIMYDKNQRPMMMIGRFRDIQDERKERDRLKQDAQIDKLTGLYNADSIRELLEHTVMEAIPLESALLIIDMDHFKDINDRFGHYQGDRVLSQTGALLQEIFGDAGLVGRLGGDEFIVYLQAPGEEANILSLCDELFDGLRQLPIAQKLNCAIQVSIGYSIAEETGNHFYRMYKHADKALYQVKDSGRNNVCKYEKQL